MKKPIRYFHKDIESGAHQLGEKVKFLQKATYLALSQHKVQGRLGWYVEVALPDFHKLLETKKLSLKRMHRIEMLKHELELGSAENAKLHLHNDALEANNEKLMINIEEDKTQERYLRSPRSHMSSMQKRAVNGVNPLPLRGGLAGLEKK